MLSESGAVQGDLAVARWLAEPVSTTGGATSGSSSSITIR